MRPQLPAILAVALVFSLPTIVPGFSLSAAKELEDHVERPSSGTSTEKMQLAVKATILSQSYCHVDASSFAMHINIRLGFTNVSDAPVILAKHIEPPDIVRVAKTADAGRVGKFEYAPNSDRFVKDNPPIPKLGESPNPQYFAVLSPGQEIDVETWTTVIGSKESASHSPLISVGDHVLQLGIAMWPYYGYDDIDNLQKRWARFGNLQHEVLYTDFLPFHIPPKFANPPCPIPSSPPGPN